MKRACLRASRYAAAQRARAVCMMVSPALLPVGPGHPNRASGPGVPSKGNGDVVPFQGNTVNLLGTTMHVRTLIELAMQHTDRRSLRTFAELVGVSHTKVAQWKNGDFPIPDDRIRQIAKLAAQDPGPWLLLIKSEQEDGELGREWAKLAKRLGATAAMVLCALGISGAMPGKAYAVSVSETEQGSQHGSMPIM